MKEFIFDSMADKFENLAGHKWTFNEYNDVSYLRKYPKVSLEKAHINDMHFVRDWCEEHFGDNWIYEWNDFYFKYEKDAVLFALRWA